MILLSISYMTGCSPFVHHTDPFYNFNDNDFPRDYLPLINPIEATRERPSSPWSLGLGNTLWIDLPKSNSQDIQEVYGYSQIVELQKFAVKSGVVMAYSSSLDMQADAYIQNGFYYWFVMVPSKNITVGFHTEDEFNQYIQTLDVQNPEWQTPDAAFKKFVETGCLEWIPDCK